MSVVIGSVTSKFAVMSSDTRSINSMGEIDSENISKSFKANKDTLIGFTGSYVPVSVLLDNGLLNMDLKPNEYLYYLFNSIGGNRLKANKDANILIIGKACTNSGFGGNFHTSDIKIENECQISENHAWHPILTPPSLDHKKYQSSVKKDLNQIIFIRDNIDEQLDAVKKYHQKIIKEMALIDNSVNGTVQQHEIIF